MNDELELLGLAGLGFAVGTYGTIVGLGGGFILVPVLLFLYPDYDPEHLTAISLFVVWTNTTSGSIAYARQGRIDYLTGLLFAASSAPGGLAGVYEWGRKRCSSSERNVIWRPNREGGRAGRRDGTRRPARRAPGGPDESANCN